MVGFLKPFLFRPELKMIAPFLVISHNQTIRCTHDHDVTILYGCIGIENDEVPRKNTGIGKREIGYTEAEHSMPRHNAIFGEENKIARSTQMTVEIINRNRHEHWQFKMTITRKTFFQFL